jgi:hypothetical protein
MIRPGLWIGPWIGSTAAKAIAWTLIHSLWEGARSL